jgi:hypothetical protein
MALQSSAKPKEKKEPKQKKQLSKDVQHKLKLIEKAFR